MPITYTPFLSTENLAETATNERAKEIETFLNGRIEGQDIADNSVGPEHIHPPKFYGSPSPRAEFVSSDIYYRRAGMKNKESHIMWDVCSEDYEPIPGLSATIHVSPQEVNHTVTANVLACWFCRDITDNNQRATGHLPNLKKAAKYKLFVKRGSNVPAEVMGTQRQIWAAGEKESRLSSRNLHIAAMVELDQGVNHVYVAVQMTQSHMKNAWRMYHFARTFICDVMYL